MQPTAAQSAALLRLIAAYKLRLAEAAERMGAQHETWGLDQQIDRQTESNALAGEDRYRLSPRPYPGLRSFDTQEGDFFFGRERNVADVQRRLIDARMVVVLGGSGSGKSSLLRAGLLPYLNTTRRIPGRDGSWYKAEFRPRKDPLGEMIDALVDQWLLPLFDLRVAELAAAMNVPADTSKEVARIHLIDKVRSQFFDGTVVKSREAVLAALLDLAGHQLDEFDRLASGGLRVPGPSLMLLLDQFEEVFRPEVTPEARNSLLNLIVDLYQHMRSTSDKGGLFLAITMRSEELHRCSEHRGLSEVVNNCVYLLDLLDAGDPIDRTDLHRAIVQPARSVFDDWGLEYDQSSPDAPFAIGVPDWLLAGAKRLSRELEHRADQLPLLQHAVQSTWHAAMRRWSGPGFNGPVTLEKADLPGQHPGDEIPDLGACLRARADKAAQRAADRFATLSNTSIEVSERALQAAFRALARRDDRGTWARRFAEPSDIQAFMAGDRALSITDANKNARWDALRQALHVFLLRGYLTGGESRPYDINHEALIRNWPQFRDWLREPEEVAYSLNRVLTEVDPTKFQEADDAAKMQLIPPDVASKVALLRSGGQGQLPKAWAEDQIAPALATPATRERWGKQDDALQRIVTFAAAADDLREKAKFNEHRREASRQRTLFLGLAGLLLAAIATLAWLYADLEKKKAQTSELNARISERNSRISELIGRLHLSQWTIAKLQADADSQLSYKIQLGRDAERARTQDAKLDIQKKAIVAQEERDSSVKRVKDREAVLRVVNRQLHSENERLWNSYSSEARKEIISRVLQTLNAQSEPNRKLRLAMYAVAAIPENDPSLNHALHSALKESRQVGYFKPPGAGQIWGVAFDPNNERRAAAGDQNGVVWLWDPLAVEPSDPDNLTAAATGVVNAVTFSADGKFLAAAYRGAGAVVWDLVSRKEHCPLRSTSDDRTPTIGVRGRAPVSSDVGGAYGVAFRGTTLAVASGDRAVHLWDVSQPGCPALPQVFRHPDLVFGVAFSRDGKLLAAAGNDGTVTVWDIEQPNEPLKFFRTGEQMFAVAFSPDGNTLVATGGEGNAYAWSVQDWRQRQFPKKGGTIGQVTFSSDGSMVVATASGASAIVMDPRTGRDLLQLGGRPGLFGVAFSPGSRYLLTGSHLSGAARLWIIGENVVVGADRRTLLEQGLQRVGPADLVLEEGECRDLRIMRIPLLELATSSILLDDMICGSPFIGHREPAGLGDRP